MILQGQTRLETQQRDQHVISGERMALQVLSKPEVLRDICDQTVHGSLSQSSATLSISSPETQVQTIRVCSCPQHRVRNNQRYKWGPLHFYKKTSVFAHNPDCPLSAYTAPDERSTRGIIFATTASSYIQRAIEFSFSKTSGAGGFSISPSFTVFNIVDTNHSPVFLVVETLADWLYPFVLAKNWRPVDNLTPEWRVLVHYALDKVIQLFRSRKASPFDVNDLNESSLHLVARMVSLTCPASAQSPWKHARNSCMTQDLGRFDTT